MLTRPDLACVRYTYDTSTGRLNKINRSDDSQCKTNTGDYQTITNVDGLITEIDTYTAGGTLTAQQKYSFYEGRQLQEIINPDATSTYTNLVYDAAGKLTEVDGNSSLSKTVLHYDSTPGRDNRVTSVEKYKTSSTSDTWNLLYAWMGGQSQYTDGDSKVTGSTRDDLGRLVKLTSPDLADPTIRVYDAASRLTTIVEDEGGATPATHAFTYDFLNRQLSADYQGSCATTGTAHPEIQRSYDALPSGVTCPMTGGCNNLVGRLAYVDVILMCSSTYSSTDGSLDQLTFFSYDDLGRVVEEYISDDSGRTADHKYTYDADGHLIKVILPSTAEIDWTYGAGGASDSDLVTAISRTPSVPVIDTVAWNPFGPWASYNWEAKIGGTALQNAAARNKSYQITNVYGARVGTSGTVNAEVDVARDNMNRATSRVYSPAVTGLTNSYYLYDEQSRVTCETTTSVTTCPTTGSGIKNNHSLSPPFMNAGDWKQLLRPIAGSTGGLTNNFNSSGTGYGTTHQITDINQSDGTPAFGHTAMAYDAFGNRSYDDNTTTLTNDRRDYTYDARHNLVNVRGQYYTGSAWHYYDVASAFDARNRRVFKSFYDETTTKTGQWFFYYDAFDRLTEARYTPDISSPSTNSVFQLFWLNEKLVAYWQVDNSTTTSKRYVTSDEADRPLQLWNWPSSGDATRVWAINPSAWGFDTNVVGSSVYQPILFAGQYQDAETIAYENDGATTHRPGLAINGFRNLRSTSRPVPSNGSARAPNAEQLCLR